MSPMHVAAQEMELHIGASESLKAKRAVVRHLVETARRRYGVSASEVDHHDLWQRTTIGFTTVAPDAHHVEEILDKVCSSGRILRSRWSPACDTGSTSTRDRRSGGEGPEPMTANR